MAHLRRASRLGASIALSLFAFASQAAVTRGWTLVDIGTLGGPGSYGAAVSNTGIVVGCADVDGTTAHAFVYRDGVMRDLGTATDSGAGTSCALAVNDDGLIAGRSAAREIVIWRESSVTHLGVQGDVGGLNDDGVLVGAYLQGMASRAFLYREGVLTPLGTLGGDSNASSTAASINARGQVVGSSGGRAFIYEQGAMRDLGTLGGNASSAKDINDRGAIVGMATNASGEPGPFIDAGAMQALPGPTYSGAISINNSGQVVGSGEGVYGYLVDNGSVTMLDRLPPVVARGWRHLEPTGINDHGWIVGTAVDPQGDLRAFLLIPADGTGPLAAHRTLARFVPGDR